MTTRITITVTITITITISVPITNHTKFMVCGVCSSIEFKNPCGIYVDDEKNLVLVSDFNNGRVQLFDMSGKYITQFSKL